MIISDIATKIIVFKYEKGLTQGEIALELQITEQHLCTVLSGKYPLTKKLEIKIRDMFRRYGYRKALDERTGEL